LNESDDDDDAKLEKNNDRPIFQQLKFFYDKDKEKRLHVKACYLHHLLDFFKETHVNIYNMELVFRKFLREKVLVEFTDNDGNIINFQEEINDLFHLLRKNSRQLYDDLKGEYFLSLEKKKINET